MRQGAGAWIRIQVLLPAAAAATIASTSTEEEGGSEGTTKKLISQACESANSNSAKFQECTELCQEHLCCFEMYGGGCKNLEEYDCDRYEDCSVLAVDLAQAIAQHVGMEHKEEAEEKEGGQIGLSDTSTLHTSVTVHAAVPIHFTYCSQFPLHVELLLSLL